MNINSAKAPNASRISSHMTRFLALCFLILGALAGCSSLPSSAPAPVESLPSGARTAPAPSGEGAVLRGRARWVPARWSDLPGWDADRTAELWPALLRGCERPAAGWAAACAEARRLAPVDDANARAWLQRYLQPYRVESLDGSDQGLITGYFEPLIEASRAPQGRFRVPVHGVPLDLAARKPYWTRQQLDTLPIAQASVRGRELAYLADPLDLLVLQIQGSGRLLVTEPDGSRRQVRVAFAGHNDLPYKSVGRWLIDQGELRADQASWPGIKAWAQLNPQRINELLWSNPRVVFFREEALPDPTVGPRGAQAVALTPGRSVAIDPTSIPYGTALWLDTTEPLSSTPLRRSVMAQDTGSAITGAVRVDYFWGWGDAAEQQAGRMRQPLRVWVLAPRS
ncbi:MAG: MltA domain-containing protein [Pseudomonadota bacterium]|nr:MltA domain-containing protein [Pseudomonadota bacterium]